MPFLEQNPVHLGLGATVQPQPDFTGELAWYESYMTRHVADGAEGRLVALHSFSASWDSWEMHPAGEELVLCTEGQLELVQELASGEHRVPLRKGDYAINPAGVWHTANCTGACTALFITAGKDTQHRPR